MFARVAVTRFRPFRSFEDFLRSASVELNQHIEAIREAGRHEWRPGAIAGLAHSIKGLGLNFGFDQLVDYAFKVQRIEGDIVQSQIPELASTFEALVVAVFNEVHQPL